MDTLDKSVPFFPAELATYAWSLYAVRAYSVSVESSRPRNQPPPFSIHTVPAWFRALVRLRMNHSCFAVV